MMKILSPIHKSLIAMVLVLWCTTTAWAQTIRNIDTDQWIHAKIILRPDAGFSDASVILGDHSGGLSSDHDLDNIDVEFSGIPDPAVYGQWSDVIYAQVVPIHLNLLPTGKVMFWENGGTGETLLDQIRLWDPAMQILSTPALPAHDTFCSGHSFMADGRLLVTGGHDNANGVGLPDASIYDPVTDSWTPLPDMNEGRWYPTNTTLANGDVLVISGSKDTNYTKNTLPQVWQIASSTWRNLTSAQEMGPLGAETYPMMFLTLDGRVFKAGPDQETWYLETSGSGAWDQGPSSNFHRSAGSAVMYDEDKILITGGGNPPTNTTEVIDLNDTVPIWRSVSPMAFARRHLNAVLLPDGKVLVTCGTSSPGFSDATGAVYAAEMWDPETEIWSTMAAMQVKRLYHSTALLLPDGRVFVAGGTFSLEGEINNRNFEIYSPPFLFKGSRPMITFAPKTVIYGETFQVDTPDAMIITDVNWIRLSSVTHSFDQNQRLNKLNFSQESASLNVTAPSDANLTPPGHYMMFILNGDGVPSLAEIIQIVLPPPSPLVFQVERATGNVFAQGSFIPNGADIAERINVSEPVEAGDIVELDPAVPGYYRKARGTSQLIAGIITTDPGFILGNNPVEMDAASASVEVKTSKIKISSRPMLALMGRVPVKATTENGLINAGDLLTVSSKPGYAMRCARAKECEGTIIGKALEGLESDEGKILVLVMGY